MVGWLNFKRRAAALREPSILLLPAVILALSLALLAAWLPALQRLARSLPAGEEIPLAKYEEEVVPQIRAFLRDNALDKKVRCAVTFFGVPIRIGSKLPSDEDAAEIAVRGRLVALLTRARRLGWVPGG